MTAASALLFEGSLLRQLITDVSVFDERERQALVPRPCMLRRVFPVVENITDSRQFAGEGVMTRSVTHILPEKSIYSYDWHPASAIV